MFLYIRYFLSLSSLLIEQEKGRDGECRGVEGEGERGAAAHKREEEFYCNTARKEGGGDAREQGEDGNIRELSRHGEFRPLIECRACDDGEREQEGELRGGGTGHPGEAQRGDGRAAPRDARQEGYTLKNSC